MILFCFWSSPRKGLCVWINYEVVCDFLFMVNYRLFRPFLSASLESYFLFLFAAFGLLQRHGMDKPAFRQLQAQLVKRPPVESLRATGGCTLEIHRQVLKGRLRGQRADASTGHAEAFAADSCSDLLVFLLDMNNAPFVIDSVFISLSLIKGACQSETGVIL